ncbi:hypothetical protein MN608_01348 [Microdochium nivale]|nr:hypothetical protein MN608_01348 [Microdochium nivale]
MADTTLLLDDPMSSPDPLADEIPSSVQSKARRIAMPHHDYSMGAARSSSPLKSPTKSSTKGRSVSPRKRTFELDVGNEATPQRILVTVEADETMRPGINRRLFPPSSPTRKVVRAEEITTRKVPLRGLSDDEGFGDDATTPRKRGRPRKSNGTPVPKTRKRAGTPLKPIGDATRPRLDLQSEASMFSDISIINDGEIRGSTPKPKPRARKTPAKRAPTPSAAIPSSEIPPEKQTTGRKRGRPRKALMPEEVAEIVMAESELDLPEMVDDEPVPAAVETARVADDVRYSIEGLNDRSSDRATEPPIDEGIGVESDAPSRMSSESMSPVPPELTILDPIFEESVGASREPADQQQQQYGEAERDANSEGVPTSDGYAPLMEPDDDGYSDNGTVESANPARQDTLTHASDFSMIAVESLPSFQASFHGNLSRITEDLNEPAELGEATNMMINQTLETLRRSIQNDNSGGDSDEEGSKGDDEASAARRGSSVGSSGGRHMRGPPARNRSAWSSSPLGSPKRRKPLPLSRQMLVGKARQADDSFSSVPDSVLNAATPARFRPQQTKAETQHQEPEEHLYEDSFSEIPDAVLEAATPAPARKISRDVPSGLQSSPLTREDLPDREADLGQERNKLPTPDGNSSSNVNPQRSGQENQELSAPRRSNSFSQSRTQIPSSPPDILVERYESLEPRPESQKRDPHREIPESPQLASYSGIGQEESSRNLEAPTSAQRPTLSPIVRVARTLQSVMSDKSSPEGLDSNLRSPFRGSHSRQSSIAKSPTPFSNDPFSRSNTNQVAPAAGATSAPPRESRPSLSQSIRSSSNRDAAHALNDPFGPQINSGQQSQTSKAQSTPPRRATPDRGSSVGSGLVTSSTKNLLPSDDQMSWGPDESPLRARSITRQSITRALRESSLAASQPRRPPQKSPLQLARDGERAPLRSTQLPRSLDNDSGDEILLDVDNDDIWEVEASRPEIQEPTIAAATAEADHPSTGRLRGKIPNPQRNSIRNEAYQDERESPSQLLLDESPQKMPVAQQTRGEHEYEDEDVEDDDIEEVPRHLPLDEGEQLPSPPALQQRKAPDVPLKRADGSDYSLLQDRSDSARIPSERSLEFVNVEEYSLIAPQTRQTGSVNNRVHPVAAVEDEHSLVAPEGNARPEPTPARSRLFGGFDIMSFFSSPSALPKEDATGKAERVNATRNKAQATQPIPAVKKAQSSLWSAGLFPSIAQKEFRPSPERGNNLLSSSAPPSSPFEQKSQARPRLLHHARLHQHLSANLTQLSSRSETLLLALAKTDRRSSQDPL